MVIACRYFETIATRFLFNFYFIKIAGEWQLSFTCRGSR